MSWAKLGNIFRRDEMQTLSTVLTSFFALHPEIQVKSVLGLTFSFFKKIDGSDFEYSDLKKDLLILSEKFSDDDPQKLNTLEEIQHVQWDQQELWQYFL